MEVLIIIFGIFIFILLPMAIIQAIFKSINKICKKIWMIKKLSSLHDFSSTQNIMGNDGNSGIAVDKKRKTVCLIKHSGIGIGKGVTLDVISYQDILSSEIFEDGETITKTVRSSQLGGVLVGGLALGGAGAIIGGLSVVADKVNKIDLRITVNRTSTPNHDINFMNIEAKNQDIVYTSAMEQARHWHGLMEVLIKRADLEDIEKERELVDENKNTFIADELAKLGDLRNQGLLTDAEFSRQKEKLLS